MIYTVIYVEHLTVILLNKSASLAAPLRYGLLQWPGPNLWPPNVSGGSLIPLKAAEQSIQSGRRLGDRRQHCAA